MDYRSRYRLACQKAFAGFSPDVSSARQPDVVLQAYHMAANGLFSHEIAEKLGKTPKAIQKIYRRYNFPCLHNIEPPKLEERQGWNGGEKLMKGYLYRRTPGHPNGTTHGCYVAVHRLVMEEKLGRLLLPTEVVDHIDGDIRNNHPDNLRVFQSNAEHLKATLAGRVPNWSEDGKRRISEGVRSMHRRRADRKAEPSHD